MGRNQTIKILSVTVALLVIISACFGLFYNSGGNPRDVESIYGETVTLFGNGVYANDSMLKATTAKGTDFVMLLVSFGLLATALKRDTGAKIKLLHGGFLASLLYYSANVAFGLVYSKMFLIYLFMFSTAVFIFIITMIDLSQTLRPKINTKHAKTAVFTMVSGCTALVWFMSILPTLLTNEPLDVIGIYTTEPTFVIDIGLILPTCILGGICLLKNRPLGYILPPVMLTFLTVIAVTVVGQTVFQLRYGVVISVSQVIGYVVTFVIFGFIAAIVNARFMFKCWPDVK